jgi:hypothetical protein
LKEKTRFYRELYGYTDSSYFGKYLYERKGILSDIPHLRPTESVIILKPEHSNLVKDFLKKEKVRFSEHKIILTKEETSKLT